MTLRQITKQNTYNKLLVFFAASANSAIWATFTRLVTEIANFKTINENIVKAQDQQGTVTIGITDTKELMRIAMSKVILQKAPKAHVWALDNNTALAPVFNVIEDDFLKGAESRSLSKADDLYAALKDNIASMASVNLTITDANLVRDGIKNYRDAQGSTGSAEDTKEAGTKTLTGLFDLADHSLDIISDLLIAEYSESNPDMVLTFKMNRHQDTVGVHHTRISAHIVYSDGSGNAEGIKLFIVGPNKTAISDIDGIAESPTFKPGTYHVIISGEGIQTKTFVQKVKRGQTVHLDIEVDRGASTGTISGSAHSATLGNQPATITLPGLGLTTNTDAFGNFLITGVAAGNQTIQCYLNTNPPGVQTQNPTVPAGGNVIVNFTFP